MLCFWTLYLTLLLHISLVGSPIDGSLHLTTTSPSTKAKITTCWHHLPFGLGHYLMQQSIFPRRWSKRWHNSTPWSRSWATISQLMHIHTTNFHLVGNYHSKKRFHLSPKPFSSQLDYVTKHPPVHPLETHYDLVVDEPQLRSTLITYLVNPTIPSLAVKVKVNYLIHTWVSTEVP